MDGLESYMSALARLEQQIREQEKVVPCAAQVVVISELASIEQEIDLLREYVDTASLDLHAYSNTVNQLLASVGLYRRPELAAENEDFIANINRKELRRFELGWLINRRDELRRQKSMLMNETKRLDKTKTELAKLLDSAKNLADAGVTSERLERQLVSALAVREAAHLALLRTRVASEHAHYGAKHVEDALLAWKQVAFALAGTRRTNACATACCALVTAICYERGARRILAAHAAPRPARTLRLALDYAFTDAMENERYEQTAQSMKSFKDFLVITIDSIQKVFISTSERVVSAEEDVAKLREDLRKYRVNALSKYGIAFLNYRNVSRLRARYQ